MKTTLASLLFAVCISVSSASFAAEKTPFHSSVIAFPSTMKLDVIIENPQGSNVIIRLVDQAGIVQATQKVTKNEKALRTRFDISALSDGVYHVVVTDGASTQTQEVNISTNVPTPAVYRTISVS
ncbi:hypothetical protein GCM10027347_24690 [Larkinella harenae]